MLMMSEQSQGLRIKKTDKGFEVTDIKSGVEIENVTHLNIELRAGNVPRVQLEVLNPDIDVNAILTSIVYHDLKNREIPDFVLEWAISQIHPTGFSICKVWSGTKNEYIKEYLELALESQKRCRAQDEIYRKMEEGDKPL